MMNTISKNAFAAVLAFATALSTAACATEEVGTGTSDEIWVDATEIIGADGLRSTELTGLGMSEDPVVVESSACACTTPACVEQFVRDSIGCGVCVDFACTDGSFVGGCVRCE